MGFAKSKRGGAAPAPRAPPPARPAAPPPGTPYALHPATSPAHPDPALRPPARSTLADTPSAALWQLAPWLRLRRQPPRLRRAPGRATPSNPCCFSCAAPAFRHPAPPVCTGLMGTFGSSMAGSMAGSMIGNTLFGGGGGQAPAPVAEAAPPAGYAPAAGPVCAFESRQFLECMSQVNDDMNYCRQYYDSFKMCSCARHSRPSVPSRAALHRRDAHCRPACVLRSAIAAVSAPLRWRQGPHPGRRVPPPVPPCARCEM